MSIVWIASIVVVLVLTLIGFCFRVFLQENIKAVFAIWGWNAFFLNLWQQSRPVIRWDKLQCLWGLWLALGAMGGILLVLGTLSLIALLNPPVKWQGVLTAIDTFAPPDLKRDFDATGQKFKDLAQQVYEMQQEIDVEAQ